MSSKDTCAPYYVKADIQMRAHLMDADTGVSYIRNSSSYSP